MLIEVIIKLINKWAEIKKKTKIIIRAKKRRFERAPE